MLSGKKALLLDMNSTFMFGEDRFDESQEFSTHYFTIGGKLQRDEVDRIIQMVYKYLETRYPDEKYRDNFPSLKEAIETVTAQELGEDETAKIIDTFAFHELGRIPDEYAIVLQKLWQRFTLGAVIDIWSPKEAWIREFKRAGVLELFSALSFSSDHGMVKPSPKPFELVLKTLGVTASETVMIGDSTRRDLGGAKGAGIDCILVGGARHPDALAVFANLLEMSHSILNPADNEI